MTMNIMILEQKTMSKKPIKIAKYRALELYAPNTPFKPRVVRCKKIYNRKNFNIRNIDKHS